MELVLTIRELFVFVTPPGWGWEEKKRTLQRE